MASSLRLVINNIDIDQPIRIVSLEQYKDFLFFEENYNYCRHNMEDVVEDINLDEDIAYICFYQSDIYNYFFFTKADCGDTYFYKETI